MQQCYLCKTKKDLHNFIRRKDGRYYRVCIKCNWEVQKNRGKKRLKHSRTHRTCYKCLRVLKNDNFTKRSTGTYFSACKDCNKYGFAQTRRARLLGSEGSFTSKEFKEKLKQYNACPICKRNWKDIKVPKGKKTVIAADHINPISKGGKNTIDNIQPLCFSCNSKKGDKYII
jgi:5-methylcytosine-specific restriction endonuclease McrA